VLLRHHDVSRGGIPPRRDTSCDHRMHALSLFDRRADRSLVLVQNPATLGSSFQMPADRLPQSAATILPEIAPVGDSNGRARRQSRILPLGEEALTPTVW